MRPMILMATLVTSVLLPMGCIEGPVALTPVIIPTTTVTPRVPTYEVRREPRIPVVPTTTTLPVLLTHQYGWYEHSGDVVALQMSLGLRSVDGIYGPQTRAAHYEALGGPAQALRVFYPAFGTAHQNGPPQTLGVLIDRYFWPEDRPWATKVAFCESSAQLGHVRSSVVSSALAIGWFQHLAKYWVGRADDAGWAGADPFDPEANVAVAAWLFYTSGPHHWNPSRTCWEEQ